VLLAQRMVNTWVWPEFSLEVFISVPPARSVAKSAGASVSVWTWEFAFVTVYCVGAPELIWAAVIVSV